MRILSVVAAALLTFSLAACKKNIQTNEAVRQAVVDHLAKRTDLALSGMDIQVSNVTFSEGKAVAMVSFTPKGGDAANGMSMQYTLEQKGGAWEVKSKADSSGGGHSGMGMPGGDATKGEAPPRELPPNHPPMGAPAK
jgi:hypothetical protein